MTQTSRNESTTGGVERSYCCFIEACRMITCIYSREILGVGSSPVQSSAAKITLEVGLEKSRFGMGVSRVGWSSRFDRTGVVKVKVTYHERRRFQCLRESRHRCCPNTNCLL